MNRFFLIAIVKPTNLSTKNGIKTMKRDGKGREEKKGVDKREKA
jgi:hypothetical protein